MRIQSFLACCFLFISTSNAATVIAVSVLPVGEYTRITIESDQAIDYSLLTLKKPDRIVLDLKDAQNANIIKTLSAKALPNDSYIKQIRVAKFQQNTTRVVIDLRVNATPKLTEYQPSGDYQHRLALDIFPIDTLENDSESSEKSSYQEGADKNKSEPETSNTNSSGAKIILDTLPAIEPDEDLDSSPDPNL